MNKIKFLIILYTLSFIEATALDFYFELVNHDTLRQQMMIKDHLRARSQGEISDDSLSVFYFQLAQESFEQYHLQSARKFIDSSFKYTPDLSLNQKAKNGLLLAQLEMEEDDIPAALELLTASLAIYKSQNDSLNYAYVLRKIGNNYDYLGDHEIAREYYQECVDLSKKIGVNEIEAACYNNFGGMYNEEGNHEEGLKYYLKGANLAEKSGDMELLHKLYHGTALAYMNLKRFKEARIYLNKSKTIAEAQNDLKLLGFTLQGFGFLYLEMKQYDSAEYYMIKTLDLAKSIGNMQLQSNANEVLEEVYFDLGKYKKAYEISKINLAINDSLYNLEEARLIQSIKSKYQAEKRERELAEKNLQLKEAGYSLARQRVWQIGLFSIVAIMALISFLLYRGYLLRKRANDLLTAKNREIENHARHVENLNSTKSRWFVNVAHELRTPITLIKGPITRVINDNKFPQMVNSDLQLIERNATHLSNLVNEILDLSRLEEGKIQIKESVFNLCRVISQLCESFAPRAQQQSINFYNKCLDEVYIKADEEKIRKIVSNLISNAFKFTPKGGKIEVMIRTTDVVEVTVKDTGKGINADDLPFIFERFFQSSDPGDEAGGGLGVGLALSKEIAEMHEGNLKVSSQFGMGSAFTLLLPASRIEQKIGVETDKGESTKMNISYQSYAKPLLLLVEDNEDMSTYVSSLIDPFFDVITASDGREGLEKLRDQKVQFIISDVMMAGMDGISFLKEIKADPLWNQIPFIHLTALSDQNVKKEALRIGIDDYLVKPFDAEELIIRVQNLYDNYLNRSAMDVGSMVESYDEKIIKKLKQEILDNLEDTNFNALRLASAAAMSERQLYRYLKSTTGLTPLQFTQEIKLGVAMDLVNKKVYQNLGELAGAVGFKQASYFSGLFEKRFGKKPTAMMK